MQGPVILDKGLEIGKIPKIMAERIQNIIAAHKALAVKSGDLKAGGAFKHLQLHVDRVFRRFAQDIDVPAETLDTNRRFSPEQLQGLETVGFTFATDVQALSLDQLWEDSSTRQLFAYITDIPELRNIVPVARQVAVNPKQPYVEGSQGLRYDGQLEAADQVVRKLKNTHLQRGTLEGVDFAPDRASVLSQLDFEYQARFSGQKLYPNYFVRSQDEYDHPGFGPCVTFVGRSGRGNQLDVHDWTRVDHAPHLRLSLVATPAGTR